MGIEAEIDATQLATSLEDIHPNYAYQVLSLEISLFSHQKKSLSKDSTASSITYLTQLYMRAVEILQDRHSQGFEFFNWKIQSLLKQRSVMEELLKDANSSTKERESALQAITRVELREKKKEHDLQVSMQSPQTGRERVKEIVKDSQLKMKAIESKIQTGLQQQEDRLASRINLRKLRSQTSTRDPTELMESIPESPNQEEFQYQIGRNIGHSICLKESKSPNKIPPRRGQNKHLFASFSNLD